ncbi:sigma-70 family RNA polymerase sigma factor [Mycobacterium sp. KBS0706]|uniref:sigma-70 family RNA polymerase sigma factor n=1 Tax=Mycobacterium sp. KBS0706 TaxID=2578109 RepID=UPI00110F8C6E|nr:sigma-70 family RNA polymerase sigma factor [Mycobacterium sp. KBS0706]TSD86425.1 sigma-70 family RNA polymerase sigma factor [Mycobacterium sp. KBS0706]
MDEIAVLIEPHIPALRRYAWALLRDDDAADDLVQDCLERALDRWHLQRRDGDLRAWLFAIQRNLFLNGLRQQARRGRHISMAVLADQPSREQSQDSRLAMRDILAALDSLPEEQRSALLLIGVEDLSYEAAARILGVPVGTIMSRLSRGREKLRRLLGSEPRAALRSVK